MKSCLFGCLGVTGLLVLFVLVTAGITAVKLKDKQPVDRDLTPVVADRDAALDTALPRRAGRLVLDVSQGELEIEPAPAGEPLSVRVRFDDEVHDFEEHFEIMPDSTWVYELRFYRTMPGLQALFRQIMGGGYDASVKVRIPPDLPTELEIELRQGGFAAELGGLWITDADIGVTQGGFALEIGEPLVEPMGTLRIRSRMGGFGAEGLGNASPRLIDIATTMGGADVGLKGAWRNDAEVRLTSKMGGMDVRLPRDVVVEGLATETPVLQRDDPETPLPVLRFTVEASMGGIDVR
jgi:hypothetical protein